ncbi:MAG: hypothetical protein JNL83_21695 [Myxococcales bacterium]|nr:hypothetical protein [Myxococcales bacterium]
MTTDAGAAARALRGGRVAATWIDFGAKDVHWEVFDLYVDADRVTGSLADDVLDVCVTSAVD